MLIADEPFSFVMRVVSQSQSEESTFVCGEETAPVLKAVCRELMTESYFYQGNIFLSFNEYLMDVYNFFLCNSNKNRFYMYKTLLQTPE